MFQNFTTVALNFNTIQSAILHCLNKAVQCLNNSEVVPEWNELLGDEYSSLLSSKRKLKGLMSDLSVDLSSKTQEYRDQVIRYIEAQNNISQLLDGSCNCLDMSDDYTPTLAIVKDVFEEGFELLRKTGLRKKHYEAIYDELKSKTCPFCGYMPLDAPGLKSEDLDHYLDRQDYPAAAANFSNLVPTCSKCNSRYKGTTNVILIDGQRHKAFYPYGNATADVCLRDSDLFVSPSPSWIVRLVPEIDEVETWDHVYDVRNRLIENALSPNYESTLDEMIDFFKNIGVYEDCDDVELIEAIDKFYQYKTDNPEQGLGFLKSKIVDLIKYRLEEGDLVAMAMVRAGLPRHQGEAA